MHLKSNLAVETAVNVQVIIKYAEHTALFRCYHIKEWKILN